MRDNRFLSELKRLPLMLAKLLAAAATLAGCTMVVLRLTRNADASLSGLLPWLLLGGAGMLLFQLCSRILERRSAADTRPSPGQARRTSLISWSLLVLGALLFLVIILLVTR